MPPKQEQEPFWHQPAFWITLMLLPLVYLIAIIVLWPSNGYSPEVRIMVVTAGFVGLITAITAFWLASSFNQNKESAKPSAPTTNVVTPQGGTTTVNNQGTNP